MGASNLPRVWMTFVWRHLNWVEAALLLVSGQQSSSTRVHVWVMPTSARWPCRPFCVPAMPATRPSSPKDPCKRHSTLSSLVRCPLTATCRRPWVLRMMFCSLVEFELFLFSFLCAFHDRSKSTNCVCWSRRPLCKEIQLFNSCLLPLQPYA